MEDLKQMCTLPGFKNVKTFIASGNVIFDAKETDTVLLEQKLEKQLRKCLGYEVKTFVRTFSELEDIVNNNPFSAKKAMDAAIHISFLSAFPDKERLRAVTSMSTDDEILRIRDRELYWWVRKGAAKLLYSNNFIEKNLAVQATTRNWNTVNKILQL